MTNKFCAKCSAELVEGTRFCRKCGHASGAFDGENGTEAETRIFEANAERGAQTRYHDQRPTGPGYLPPDEIGNLAAVAPTQVLKASRRRSNVLIISSVIVLVAIIALTLLAAIKLMSNPVPTPIAAKPEIPVPPKAPQPPQLPQPPQPPVAGTGSSNSLDYPGAEVTMEMTHGAEGSMRQLQTSDSFEKVVAWYTNKLKPTEKIITPEGPSAVLKGKETTAIINGDEEDGTQILLKKGIDK